MIRMRFSAGAVRWHRRFGRQWSVNARKPALGAGNQLDDLEFTFEPVSVRDDRRARPGPLLPPPSACRGWSAADGVALVVVPMSARPGARGRAPDQQSQS